MLVSGGLYVICAGLAAILLPSERRTDRPRVTLSQHLRESGSLLRHSRPWSSSCWAPPLPHPPVRGGDLLAARPPFPPTPGWQSLLGAVCTLGFGLTILGSGWMGRFPSAPTGAAGVLTAFCCSVSPAHPDPCFPSSPAGSASAQSTPCHYLLAGAFFHPGAGHSERRRPL